jgi:hypothetical protein
MAITHADLLECWPEAQLRRLPEGVVAALGLPDEAVQVLVEVGLPVHVDHYEFEPVAPRLFTPPKGSGTWCQIGQDEGGDFSLDLATGTLWSCVDTPDLRTRFVNSTLSAFVQLLCADVRVRRDYGDDVEGSYEAMNAAVKETDLAALDDDDNYWAVILEQMETGLF